jgi:serine/threonine protein kinase
MEIRAGANLGRYQLLAEIGRGAMGTVYQALDPEIDRLVAIKTFSAFDSTSFEGTAFRERFAQEARAAGRLMHPGIVAIYDRGEEPTTRTPYIVMEYIAGQPLSRLLVGSATRLEERFAIQVAKEVAEALAFAHERGVVHRDIKPSNVLITEEGNAKIADFGVARLDATNMTVHGQVVGTPAYMSPEQLTGSAVDGRSDIFSLGVILYTMLIGFRPFQGNGASTIGFKVVNQEPIPITSFHLDLSKDTEYVVARAMAKNPSDRYQTGTAFAQDLGDILDGQPPRSRRDTKVPVSADVFRVAEDYRPFFAAAAVPRQRTQSDRTGTGAAATAMATAATPAPPKNRVPFRRSFDWQGAPAMVAIAIVAIGGITVFAGVYTHRSKTASASTAAVRTDVPALPSQQIATPGISPSATEPTVEVKLPSPKPAPPKTVLKEADSDSDVTVVHVQPPVQTAAPVVLAAATPKPAPATPWRDPLSAGQPSTLELALLHHFKEAEVSVWVDDKLEFSGVAHGEEKKRLFVLHAGVEGKESHEIRFSPGEHEIKVQVTSKDDQYNQSGTIRSTFLDSRREVLSIHCNKKSIELKLADSL